MDNYNELPKHEILENTTVDRRYHYLHICPFGQLLSRSVSAPRLIPRATKDH